MMADPDGIQRVRLNPPLGPNHFVFNGIFKKNEI